MKSFKDYLNEIKLQKPSKLTKGTKVQFINPDKDKRRLKGRTYGYKYYEGVVTKDASNNGDVEVKSSQYEEDYGEDKVTVPRDKIRQVIR